MTIRNLMMDESGRASQTKVMGWLAFLVVSFVLVREAWAGPVSTEFALGYLGLCIAGRAFSAFNHKRSGKDGAGAASG